MQAKKNTAKRKASKKVSKRAKPKSRTVKKKSPARKGIVHTGGLPK